MRKGQFEKGNKMGEKRGQNKITKTVKETVLMVFNELQGIEGVCLKDWAQDQPTEFYKIAAKLIPTEVKANVDANVTQKIITGQHIGRMAQW